MLRYAMQLLYYVDEAKNHLIDCIDIDNGVVDIRSVSQSSIICFYFIVFILFLRWKHLIVWQHYL